MIYSFLVAHLAILANKEQINNSRGVSQSGTNAAQRGGAACLPFFLARCTLPAV